MAIPKKLPPCVCGKEAHLVDDTVMNPPGYWFLCGTCGRHSRVAHSRNPSDGKSRARANWRKMIERMQKEQS